MSNFSGQFRVLAKEMITSLYFPLASASGGPTEPSGPSGPLAENLPGYRELTAMSVECLTKTVDRYTQNAEMNAVVSQQIDGPKAREKAADEFLDVFHNDFLASLIASNPVAAAKITTSLALQLYRSSSPPVPSRPPVPPGNIKEEHRRAKQAKQAKQAKKNRSRHHEGRRF